MVLLIAVVKTLTITVSCPRARVVSLTCAAAAVAAACSDVATSLVWHPRNQSNRYS